MISGETGVVVKAGDKADTLTLQVCYKSGQGDLRRPIQRNTSLDGNKVRKMLLSDRQIKQLLCEYFSRNSTESHLIRTEIRSQPRSGYEKKRDESDLLQRSRL